VGKQRLDQDLIRQMTSTYNEAEESALERFIFTELSEKVRWNGQVDPEDFFKICEWKSTRTKTLVRTNPREHIQEVTRLAFSSRESLRVPLLCILNGVRIPTASAILTVWHPDEYTVYDVRVCDAMLSLSHHLLTDEVVEVARKSYSKYLEVARQIAIEFDVSLRDLDKTLWTWDKNRGL
jgi:thermostable 8-oxoguanine DNA glycosylase